MTHRPGREFAWELSATRAGLAPADWAYRVCDPVRAGAHRFVYWGVTPPDADGREYTVGARFAVGA